MLQRKKVSPIDRSIKQAIIDRLRSLPVYFQAPDQIEHIVRCPFCGDSRKDPTHAHLYIKIDVNDDSLMPYYCFRCGEKGMVSEDLLDDLGLRVTEEELTSLKNYNKLAEKVAIRKGEILRTENFTCAVPTTTRENLMKLQYLNDRLGTRFSLDELPKLKIVPSLLEFMVHNDIETVPNVEPWILDTLNREYVGFLSANNNLITFRHVDYIRRKAWRYYKLYLNPLNPDGSTFYSVPSRVPMFYDGGLHVHIAEGTFDILSIRYNLQPQHDNQVFYASCGYSYLNVLRHLARHGLVGNSTLHIYADADKSDDDHRKILKSPVVALHDHVVVHRNGAADEKDYGVPLDRIVDTERVLW